VSTTASTESPRRFATPFLSCDKLSAIGHSQIAARTLIQERRLIFQPPERCLCCLTAVRPVGFNSLEVQLNTETGCGWNREHPIVDADAAPHHVDLQRPIDADSKHAVDQTPRPGRTEVSGGGRGHTGAGMVAGANAHPSRACYRPKLPRAVETT